MKKFIKGNWFKIIIVFILVVITCFYLFGYFLPRNKQMLALDLQEKCLKIGQKAYKTDLEQGVADKFYEPRYGYSKKLNTCIYFGGYHDSGNPSKGVSNDIFKNNCDSYWEQWVKNSYTNEKIIQVYNLTDNKCHWTTKIEIIEKFQTETDELFNFNNL